MFCLSSLILLLHTSIQKYNSELGKPLLLKCFKKEKNAFKLRNSTNIYGFVINFWEAELGSLDTVNFTAKLTCIDIKNATALLITENKNEFKTNINSKAIMYKFSAHF